MHLKIQTKIYLSMLLLAFMLIGSMLTLINWSFKEGYSEYYHHKGEEIHQHFQTELQKAYSDHQNWSQIKGKRRNWEAIVEAVAIKIDPAYKDKRDNNFLTNRQLNHSHGAPHSKGPQPRPRNRIPIPTLAKKFTLFDLQHNYVAGPPFKNKNAQLTPIKDQQGNTIGYSTLELDIFKQSPVAIMFFNDNMMNFLFIVVGILSISLLATLPIARAFLQPIQKLQQGTHSLKKGNYSHRLNIQSNDEIQTLSNAFNELAARLETSEQQRKQWVADISHELRTPLSVLKINIEAIEDGINEATPENLTLLQNRVSILGALVDDLHELSLSEIGSLSYEKANIDIITILKDSINAFEIEYKEQGLSLINDLKSEDSFISNIDSRRIGQVFHNILKNSLKYTDKPGQVNISVSINKNNLDIIFEDSSPTIEKSQLPLIFDRFYRVENSRNRKTGGSGLGLAICKNIINAHNGDITAHPSSLGGLKIHIHIARVNA